MIDNWKSPDWQKQARSAVELLQRHLGLAREGLKLSGDWDHHHLKVEYRKGKQAITRFILSQKHVFNTSFQLSRQGVIDNLFGPTVQQDIIIGANEFDDAVVIQAWKTDAIKSLLKCEDVRQSSLRLFNDPRFVDVSISNHTITVSAEGVVKGILEVESILYLLKKAVKAFELAGDLMDQPDPVEERVEPKVEREVIVELVQEDEPEEEELQEPESEIIVVEPAKVASASVAVPEKTAADYSVGETIRVSCLLEYIIPKNDGWVLAAKINEPGVLRGGDLEYMIGAETYQILTRKLIQSRLVISGEVVEFDSVSKRLVMHAKDVGNKSGGNQIRAAVTIRV